MGLTNRQKRFVEFYLQSWNASDAARKAGYKGRADVTGSRLLAKVSIQEHVKLRMRETAMQSDEVLKRLADQARFSVTELIVERQLPVFDRDGNQVDIKTVYELDWEQAREKGHLLKSLANTTSGVKIEAYDAQEALNKIGKALGILKENIDQHTTNEELQVHFYLPSNEREADEQSD